MVVPKGNPAICDVASHSSGTLLAAHRRIHQPTVVQIIECLACGDQPPDFEPEDDLTLPDNKGLQAQALQQIIAYRVTSLPSPGQLPGTEFRGCEGGRALQRWNGLGLGGGWLGFKL